MKVSDNKNSDFDSLYEQYQTMVYKLSLKYSDYDDDLAEDAMQHTFLELHFELQSGETIANVQTYLHTVVKHYTLNKKRDNRKYARHDNLEEFCESEDLVIPSAEELYVEKEEMRQIRIMVQIILREVKKKNVVWYYIVVEVFLKNRNQSEVAKELNMNDTAMYATVRRIRKWSKKHRARFEEEAKSATKEVSDGHLFCFDDEYAHIFKKKCL